MFDQKKFQQIIEELQDKFSKNVDFVVDVQDLETYKNHGHPPQNFARFPEPDDEDWDEDEFYAKHLEKAIEYIEADGLFEYVDCITEEEEPIYQPKIIEWLVSEIARTGF